MAPDRRGILCSMKRTGQGARRAQAAVVVFASLFSAWGGVAVASTPDAVTLVLRPTDAGRGWSSGDGDVAKTPPLSLAPLPAEAGYVVSKAIGSLHLGRNYSLLSSCEVLKPSAPQAAVLAITNSSASSRRISPGVRLGDGTILWLELPLRTSTWQYDLRWYRRGTYDTVSCSMVMFLPQTVLKAPASRLADLRYFAQVVGKRVSAAVR
jgi:hypothetical protein